MPFRRTPVRSRTGRIGQRPRRRVDTARFNTRVTLVANTPNITRPLSQWIADIGLAAGGQFPGMTIAGIRYRLSANAGATAITTAEVCWGFGVFNEMTTTAADFSPVSKQHLDWMEYGRGDFTLPVNTNVQLLGNGDEGFRTVRSKRKILEVEDDLQFVIQSDAAPSFTLSASVAVMLP